MAGGPTSAPDYSTGYRGLASSYRTRLFVAIVVVIGAMEKKNRSQWRMAKGAILRSACI